MKKVGVIIPSYNQGRYLRQAIESALQNAANVEMDIAVIDGGSTDESRAILSEYADRLTFWCSEPDGGQAAAINKGIRALPECEYYMWLNSDDVFENAFAVAGIVDFAQSNQLEVCYGLSHFIDEQGRVIGEYPVEEYSRKKLGKYCFLSQPSVLFSRAAYETTGPINESFRMCLDYEYWIRLAQNYEFGFFREYVGSTRMYAGTKTSRMQQRHLTEAMSILIKYYGDVPMHWIVTKILADRPDSVWHKLPRRILLVLFRPLKKKYIRKSLEENKEC